MVKVQPGQWPRHKSMHLPHFSLKLHYFWMVSPTCPPQRSSVRELPLSHGFLEAQLGLGYLCSVTMLEMEPSAQLPQQPGTVPWVGSSCSLPPAWGLEPKAVAWPDGQDLSLVTGTAGIPQISSCPAVAASAPTSPATGVVPFTLCSGGFDKILSTPHCQASLSTVSVYNRCDNFPPSQTPSLPRRQLYFHSEWSRSCMCFGPFGREGAIV